MHLDPEQYASAIALMASVSLSLSIMRRIHVIECLETYATALWHINLYCTMQMAHSNSHKAMFSAELHLVFADRVSIYEIRQCHGLGESGHCPKPFQMKVWTQFHGRLLCHGT
jgi:hypothetical protein